MSARERFYRGGNDAWSAIVALRTLPNLTDAEIVADGAFPSRAAAREGWMRTMREGLRMRREARPVLRRERLVAEARRVAGLLGRACGELTARAAKVAGRAGENPESNEPFPGADILHGGAIDFGPTWAEAEDAVCDAAFDAFLTAHDGRLTEVFGKGEAAR